MQRFLCKQFELDLRKKKGITKKWNRFVRVSFCVRVVCVCLCTHLMIYFSFSIIYLRAFQMEIAFFLAFVPFFHSFNSNIFFYSSAHLICCN